MARTKNRGYQQTSTPTYTARRWKMGGYIRLSREDLQKINRGLDDSNSVKNQRDILNDFHHNHIDEFESYVFLIKRNLILTGMSSLAEMTAHLPMLS